jgi:hypothetical protein
MPICITDEKLKLIIIYGEHAIPGENLINYWWGIFLTNLTIIHKKNLLMMKLFNQLLYTWTSCC